MTSEVYSLLLDQRTTELNEKAASGRLNKFERAELRALTAHQDKTPAVAQRIRILAIAMAQPNRWGLMLLSFSRKFRENLAELEALIQYGHSPAVWEIAYLARRKATGKLDLTEKSELHYLTVYHDSPDVLRISELKIKEESGRLSDDENRELAQLQRNIYRQDGIPSQVLDLFWPRQNAAALDLS